MYRVANERSSSFIHGGLIFIDTHVPWSWFMAYLTTLPKLLHVPLFLLYGASEVA
jgi:hypothetical protein